MVRILPLNYVAVFSAGYYMYFESSPPVKKGYASLISPLFTPPYFETGCFSFWYHIYGRDIGNTSLRVFLQDSNSLGSQIDIFLKSQNQGNRWIYGQANVTTEANWTVCII